MNQEGIAEYLEFMHNPNNIRQCGGCPENQGFKGNNKLPCGQNCWVSLHCYEKRGDENCS